MWSPSLPLPPPPSFPPSQSLHLSFLLWILSWPLLKSRTWVLKPLWPGGKVGLLNEQMWPKRRDGKRLNKANSLRVDTCWVFALSFPGDWPKEPSDACFLLAHTLTLTNLGFDDLRLRLVSSGRSEPSHSRKVIPVSYRGVTCSSSQVPISILPLHPRPKNQSPFPCHSKHLVPAFAQAAGDVETLELPLISRGWEVKYESGAELRTWRSTVTDSWNHQLGFKSPETSFLPPFLPHVKRTCI